MTNKNKIHDPVANFIMRDESEQDLNRSSSAPPVEYLKPNEHEDSTFIDARRDPRYAAFYHANSRLDPRLPPPLYAPGQSWQMWSNKSDVSVNSLPLPEARLYDRFRNLNDEDVPRKNLVDMIQEDFPRTPSPVYALKLRQQRQEKELSVTLKENPEENFVTSVATLSLESSNVWKPNDSDDIFHSEWSRSRNRRSVTNQVEFSKPVFPVSRKHKSFNAPEVPKDRKETPTPSDILKVRSSVLEEFRSMKTKRFELKDTVGHIAEFSGDQHGSRFIQQKLEAASEEEKETIFKEIYPTALKLMTDVFGNYVIQKFFEHGTHDQKVILSQIMTGHVLTLSLQMYGCRVVQKSLEFLPEHCQAEIVEELNGFVLKCVKDQNGNHVIQKCIERVTSFRIQFIIEAFESQVYSLATHPYGCRVIQRIFEHCPSDQTRKLLSELHKDTSKLVLDQYGNYVIQHILEKGEEADKSIIVGKIHGQVLQLSRHKFASNVVEKCVAFGSANDRQRLIEEVISEQGEIIPIQLMMRDQYANYVIQKMLDVVDGKQRKLLIETIAPFIPSLKKFTYGKHIISKVEKLASQFGLQL